MVGDKQVTAGIGNDKSIRRSADRYGCHDLVIMIESDAASHVVEVGARRPEKIWETSISESSSLAIVAGRSSISMSTASCTPVSSATDSLRSIESCVSLRPPDRPAQGR